MVPYKAPLIGQVSPDAFLQRSSAPVPGTGVVTIMVTPGQGSVMMRRPAPPRPRAPRHYNTPHWTLEPLP